ncbi:polysaccharide deacetylase family protein [Kitasatospora sp. NBC_01250]|uniref:polysaccharide deacetylase family protein n=1 Tax=Kitasatospora sp. NBC_01250 TaxID=2903571 RepID=UPI002E307F0E|nr:polysaccharide deacetylase family protein [Kitasatospora sp. NBC_01250]
MNIDQIITPRRLVLTFGCATLLCACGRAGVRASRAPAPLASATGDASDDPSGSAEPSEASPSAAATSASPAPAPTPSAAGTVPPADPAGAAGEADTMVHAGPKTVALTFDDGPNPIDTPRVLEILHKYGVTATFFMIGMNVRRYPDTVRDVVAAGHRIGNHSWSHPDLGTLSKAGVRRELQRTSDIIADTCGERPVLFRAPGGHFTRNSYAVCAEMGLRSVCWDVDPEDWSNPGAGTIVQRVLTDIRTGSIVLNHDGALTDGLITAPGSDGDRSQTVDALRVYLPQLVEAGYRFTLPDGA